ncbi:MAG: hypothetical protein Q7O66_16540 [Dehalococcoidia bacterium]|nr:hypothetical protein [Dehalococcoidia bacterium]
MRGDEDMTLDYKKDREKIFRCSCGGNHYLSISHWSGDPSASMTLEAADHYEDYGLWGRLKAAWQIIREGQHMWFEIVLDPAMTDAVCTELMALERTFLEEAKEVAAE